MKSDELKRSAEHICKEKVLRSADIPAIDLYLDQILTLAFEKDGEAQLTKTMINNYSKDGLIKPVKGKKYSREHIVQMLMIRYLKGVLSIGDIKRVMDGVYAVDGFAGEALIGAYDRFLDVKSEEIELFDMMTAHFSEKNGLSPEDSGDFLVMLMSIVSFSDSLKRLALALIDSEYPELKTDKKTEKTKEKKEKTKKAEDKAR